jgi:hypothetical protein
MIILITTLAIGAGAYWYFAVRKNKKVKEVIEDNSFTITVWE